MFFTRPAAAVKWLSMAPGFRRPIASMWARWKNLHQSSPLCRSWPPGWRTLRSVTWWKLRSWKIPGVFSQSLEPWCFFVGYAFRIQDFKRVFFGMWTLGCSKHPFGVFILPSTNDYHPLTMLETPSWFPKMNEHDLHKNWPNLCQLFSKRARGCRSPTHGHWECLHWSRWDSAGNHSWGGQLHAGGVGCWKIWSFTYQLNCIQYYNEHFNLKHHSNRLPKTGCPVTLHPKKNPGKNGFQFCPCRPLSRWRMGRVKTLSWSWRFKLNAGPWHGSADALPFRGPSFLLEGGWIPIKYSMRIRFDGGWISNMLVGDEVFCKDKKRHQVGTRSVLSILYDSEQLMIQHMDFLVHTRIFSTSFTTSFLASMGWRIQTCWCNLYLKLKWVNIPNPYRRAGLDPGLDFCQTGKDAGTLRRGTRVSKATKTGNKSEETMYVDYLYK